MASLFENIYSAISFPGIVSQMLRQVIEKNAHFQMVSNTFWLDIMWVTWGSYSLNLSHLLFKDVSFSFWTKEQCY